MNGSNTSISLRKYDSNFVLNEQYHLLQIVPKKKKLLQQSTSIAYLQQVELESSRP